MKLRGLSGIITLISIVSSFFISGTAYSDSDQLYTYYNTNDDATSGVYDVYEYGQTFNTTLSYTVDMVRLRLYQVGSAGAVTVGIRLCNSSTGLPEGPDLTSGVYDGDLLVTNTSGSFREISLTEYTLAADTQYAIVCRGEGVDSSNGVFWRSDNSAPSYTGGYYINSSNSGVSWAANTSRDFMFELYGKPAMEVYNAQVYSDFGEDGDGWLFVINYKCEEIPEDVQYLNYGVENYYQLRLYDGSELISSVPLQQWGWRPGCIYLNGDSVDTLEWGHDYIIRLYGTYGDNAYTDYTLDSSDWIGEAWSQLDSWVISLAVKMEIADAKSYLTDGPDGQVLNTAGGAIFTKGIPYLPEMRPSLFQYSLSTLEYTKEDWSNAYLNNQPDWESWMGPEVTAFFNALGSMMGGISGQWALGLVFMFIYLLIAGVGVFAGHTVEGLIIGAPIVLLAMDWKIFAGALVASVVVVMVYKWIKREYFEST